MLPVISSLLYIIIIIQTAEKLITFFKNLGVNYITDTTLSRDFALIERYVQLLEGQGNVWLSTIIL